MCTSYKNFEDHQLITFQLFILHVWLRVTDEGFITRNALMVHTVNLIRLKWCIHLSRSLYLNFNKLFYDLLGMIINLGPCTLFVTLSAADLKWTDTLSILAKQHGKNLSVEEVRDLSWETDQHTSEKIL